MRAALIAAIALTGCGTATPIPPSAEGFEALRFNRLVRLGGGAGAFEPTVGTVLVADRQNAGGPVFCGALPLRDPIVTVRVNFCAYWRDGKLYPGAESGFTGSALPVPPDAVELVRVR